MRKPRHDILWRPEPPPEFAHAWKNAATDEAGVYVVMQQSDVVAVYHSAYFRSTNEVTADLLAMIQGGWQGPWSEDYVVWCNSRVMAVVHQPMDEVHRRVVTFNDPRNDPIKGKAIPPWPHWPMYEEWVESGRGDLWKTEDDHNDQGDDD